jgi:hypothetical protein
MSFLFIIFISAIIWTILFVVIWKLIRRNKSEQKFRIPVFALLLLFMVFLMIRFAIYSTSFGNFGGGQKQIVPLPNNYYAFYDSDFDYAVLVEGLANTYNDKNAIALGRLDVKGNFIYGERKMENDNGLRFFIIDTEKHKVDFMHSLDQADSESLKSFGDYWNRYWNWRKLIFLF